MWTMNIRLWRFMLCILFCVTSLAISAQGDDEIPSESQCRPYIEKALKELESGDVDADSNEKNDSSEVKVDNESNEDCEDDGNESEEQNAASIEVADGPYVPKESAESGEVEENDAEEPQVEENKKESGEENENKEDDDGDSKEQATADEKSDEQDSSEGQNESEEQKSEDDNDNTNEANESDGSVEDKREEDDDIKDEDKENNEDNSNESDDQEDENDSKSSNVDVTEDDNDSEEKSRSKRELEHNDNDDDDDDNNKDEDETKKTEEDDDGSHEKTLDDKSKEMYSDSKSSEHAATDDSTEDNTVVVDDGDTDKESNEDNSQENASNGDEKTETDGSEEESTPEEELLKTGVIPENLRSRKHITQVLRLDEEASEAEMTIEKAADIVLRDLKRLYENSIKPLEVVYKYRDLSNRHFGDPEIFSKPLVLFMGPWSGGKSSIVNYLTGLEFTEWSLRTGAEPSPAYFNILMHGKDPEVLDGTQLAADWTFSGLQKFGQGLEERLRGLKYPSKLLEKVNIVEIPGILEVRKQISRVFPFNDACQWFIDRADIIFLVYDPSKLDAGPETEAILDQLKGRESQTRILLNKADSVKPEELMRVQSALIWNISPLMSSAQPPVMYTVSLWSMPYESSAPVRLLQAQERELLRDLRQAIDKRIENKIASARRFAVRVRNHAKMVDCYLTTYYNHKTIFGNKKLIADAIIENPQNYHIYEGLSTLTNISRYDLPDPETYRDFFRLNPLYEFQQLSATCTYFRGCPITRLDVAIAYDLPELVGKYKKMVENATPQGMPKS